MKISVLASGSTGNCTYIESNRSKILVDAGISMRRIKNNLNDLVTDITKLNGILITHEHSDHVKGLQMLQKYYDIPIFINQPTLSSLSFKLLNPKIFSNNFNINELNITVNSISHDASQPVSFKISNNDNSIGMITDLGVPNNNIKKVISESDAIVLEANYDVDMVLNGPYPYHLKQRIMGELGHLSNIDAGLLIKNHASKKLNTVFLAHISQNNNTYDLALKTFYELTKNMNINRILTNHKERTKLINLKSNNVT